MNLLSLTVALVAVSSLSGYSLVQATTNTSDCLQALFQLAGVRSSFIPGYVEAFRSTRLQTSALFNLSFLNLVTLLEGSSYNITNAGDVFRLHSCLSIRGECRLHPICLNGGSCVYSNGRGRHGCQCTSSYEGDRCQTHVADPLTRLTRELERVSLALEQLQSSSSSSPSPPIAESVGVTYTRWGRELCNSSSGAELVYNGSMAGQHFADTGGASNYLCLPFQPEYSSFMPGVQNIGRISGTELETGAIFAELSSLHDYDPYCAVCEVPGRSRQIMIPARLTCPPSWTREYKGYLMSAHYVLPHQRTEYICVDGQPDVIPGSSANNDGALLYTVEADCSRGLSCPPYSNEKELTCVVCTR